MKPGISARGVSLEWLHGGSPGSRKTRPAPIYGYLRHPFLATAVAKVTPQTLFLCENWRGLKQSPFLPWWGLLRRSTERLAATGWRSFWCGLRNDRRPTFYSYITGEQSSRHRSLRRPCKRSEAISLFAVVGTASPLYRAARSDRMEEFLVRSEKRPTPHDFSPKSHLMLGGKNFLGKMCEVFLSLSQSISFNIPT
jgi:hypothetical protein